MKKILVILILLTFDCESKSQTGWTNINLGIRNYKSVNFINQNTGYIFGDEGTVFKTTNDGNNWIQMNTTGFTALKKGFYKTELFGYGFGTGYRKTTDGGNNWVLLNPNYVEPLGDRYTRDIFFPNPNTCFSAGGDIYPIPNPCCYDGVIYKTTNSGINWSEVRRENYCEFTDIEFKDDNTGCVISNCSILRTTDAGNSWTYQSDINVYGISMTDPFKDTIFIAGYLADSGAVTRSTDGGNNWALNGMRTSRLFKVNFINSVTGYCTGNNGIVIKTTNAGENWTALNSGTNKKLNDIYFINKDTGFVVGDSGVVLKTTTGGILTGLSEPAAIIPDSFILEQNYPNPFNPRTVINYELDAANFVSLKVYDILGNVVATLVHQKQNAGSYQINFDGSNFSSGVYYYRIETNSFVETKKMLMMK